MGTLYIVATPIGNLEDISIRAIKTLFSVDVIACEDTRRTGMLMVELRNRYASLISQGKEKPALQSYYESIEDSQTPEIINMLENGMNMALVSDAGTPLINDPGFVLIHEARKRNIPVISIPGASALLTALTSSGLPANTFMYMGYPPEKQFHRLKLFSDLPKNTTLIFYAAPHKLLEDLEDLKQVAGDIEITICRELTKIHEETWSGKISEALLRYADPKGEIVLLVRI